MFQLPFLSLVPFGGLRKSDHLKILIKFFSFPDNLCNLNPGRNSYNYSQKKWKIFYNEAAGKKLVEKGIDKNQTLIINFEDPHFTQLDTALLQKIYETYLESLYPKEKPYIFLDEI
jgi:hypothetical protein